MSTARRPSLPGPGSALLWLLLAGPAPGATTLTSIVVDGAFNDRAAVLTNPENTTFDGDASTPTCADSTDRDCPLTGAEQDLRRFAWTWDASAY